MNDLTMTNVWLAVMACVSLMECLLIVAAGFLAYNMYVRVVTLLTTVEREHIAPLHARVDDVLDEMERATARINRAQASMTTALLIASNAGGLIAEHVRARAWPIVGILRGLRAAARATTASAGSTHPSGIR